MGGQDNILRTRPLFAAQVRLHTRPPPRPAPAAEAGEPEQKAQRRELGDEEVCAICYDVMVSDTASLTYCRESCGNNVHTKCMKLWADNRIKSGEEVTCPMCRANWGVPDWINNGRSTQVRRAARSPTQLLPWGPTARRQAADKVGRYISPSSGRHGSASTRWPCTTGSRAAAARLQTLLAAVSSA